MATIATISAPPEPNPNPTLKEVKDFLKDLSKIKHPHYPGLDASRAKRVRPAVAAHFIYGWEVSLVQPVQGISLYSLTWDTTAFCPQFLHDLIDAAKMEIDQETGAYVS